MGRAPCCDKANVKKGPWSPDEDEKLKDYIKMLGGTSVSNWIALPQKAGLRRCGKSCRLRWLNYLRPNIKHGEFSDDEDRLICSLFDRIGSRWSVIAAQLPGRTDNDIKNYWNTKLKKRLTSHISSSSAPQVPETRPPHRATILPHPLPPPDHSSHLRNPSIAYQYGMDHTFGYTNTNPIKSFGPGGYRHHDHQPSFTALISSNYKVHQVDDTLFVGAMKGDYNQVSRSSSSTTDGSCTTNQVIIGDHDNYLGLQSRYDFSNGTTRADHDQIGTRGSYDIRRDDNTVQDYDSIEEIKQLISGTDSSNMCINNLNLFLDHQHSHEIIKTEDQVLLNY